MSVTFISLKSGAQVHSVKFASEVADMCVNKRVVCVAFRERVVVMDARYNDALIKLLKFLNVKMMIMIMLFTGA